MSIEKKPGNVVNTIEELRSQAGAATSWASRTGRDPTPPFSTPVGPASAPFQETIPMTITHERMREVNRTRWPDYNSKLGGEVGLPPAPERKD